MQLKKIILGVFTCSLTTVTLAQPTDLDQYLLKKKIVDQNYSIKNTTALNEILDYISDEDSRTMPYQLDQNIVIEKMRLYADHVEISGLITSPDFKQFAQDIGDRQVHEMMKKNLVHSCPKFFEHQFQRVNPYQVKIKLTAEQKNYDLSLKNSDCNFE
ncbi:hypothetical protein [Acinetobacter zhairhuonensis]|uniref:hypothetical protein n=1 Tax=Acinetobacter sp. A7.4 TaxID=2919921 RepID=UPI001F4DDEE3|nr:hypothetical protein [Acinetobacter sp. A7.4]MCJ8160751.1 hypothetical protein [Acinetobacter sp. A7.4]